MVVQGRAQASCGSPVLNAGVYAFISLPHGSDAAPLRPIATFLEPEGLSVIVDEQAAVGIPVLFRAVWITLTVHSDLATVGLTAAQSPLR